MILTAHFTLEEMIATSHREIDNTPTPEIIDNLKILCMHLESVRNALGKPIHVVSGYRCEELNKAVGGADNSRHKLGLAADIICPQFGTPFEVCQAIVMKFKEIPYFDQLIYEHTWAHFGISPADQENRGDILTFVGLNTYVKGLKNNGS